ncbi:dTDP-4-dehydrorhamnose reductase [Neisseriaceae bacterium ESL0693]|nr:dTDP-4-dehydrorhamnose reductase [Neisseriaceae bacterium ESL0693]
MRILLTGAKGQIGRCLKDRLPEEWELIASDSKTLDITEAHNVSSMVKTFEPDIIVNAAAYTQVDQAETEAARAFAINATGTLNLANAAKAIDARLIHLSTDMVFDGRQSMPITEATAPDPVNVYGKSKLAGELLALNAHVDTTIIRTAWVFSEYGHNFVRTILTTALKQQTIAVVADQVSCPTYAGDVAEAIIQMIHMHHVRGLWHFCGQNIQTKAEFAQHILHLAAQQDPRFASVQIEAVQTADYPAAATRPAYAALSDQALRQKLPQPIPDTPLARIITQLLPTIES